MIIAVSSDGVRLPIARARAERAVRSVLRAERVRHAIVSVTFVSNARIRTLNRRHLGRNRLTDVIAFAFRRTGPRAPVTGDVYIAADVARSSAAQNGVTAAEEVLRLVVHGTLHVLGYEHPDGATRMRSAMWRRQEQIMRRVLRQT